MPRLQGCRGAAMPKDVLYAAAAGMQRSGDAKGCTVCLRLHGQGLFQTIPLHFLHPCRSCVGAAMPMAGTTILNFIRFS